ncbi:hypothetical protein ES705_50933 [subsurface metagenome]
MKTIVINKSNLVSIDVKDDVIDIYVRESSGANTLVRIEQVAWDKICERVIDDMSEGATLGEQKRGPDGKWVIEDMDERATPGEEVE